MKPKQIVTALLVASSFWASCARAQQAEPKETHAYQGIDRRYVLHKSPNGTGAAPAIVAFHGLNQSIESLRQSWTLDAVADREGFHVIYPEAVGGRWAYADTRPVALPNGGQVDDVGFFTTLVEKLTADKVVDPARIYVVGVSNGGLMVWTLACQAADRIAAAAPLISGMIERQAELCSPKRLAPLMAIAGTDDWAQAYDGAMGANFRLMSIPESLEFWRRLRGCADHKLTPIPQRERADLTAAILIEWTQCANPSPQRFFRIQGGGHYLPSFAPLADRDRRRHGGRSQTIETAEELWAFFRSLTP